MDYQPNSPNTLVPLVVLALEVGTTADELAAQLGDDVVSIDAVTGLRVVPAESSRAHLGGLRGMEQAVRERAEQWLAESSARSDEEHRRLMRRVDAIQARPTSGNPFADVLVGHLEGRLDHAAAERDELLRSEHTGGLPYHPIRSEKD